MTDDLGDITLAHLDRYLNAVDYPPAQKRFSAVAVICESLVADELTLAPDSAHEDYTVIVISIPELRDTYTNVFLAAGTMEPASNGVPN